jgi:phage tail sheath protein FI
MMGLFRQSAFMGGAANEAFFVRCDATTTSQEDIDQGIVNVMIGFAPVMPAEFVIIYLQQMAGQTA